MKKKVNKEILNKKHKKYKVQKILKRETVSELVFVYLLSTSHNPIFSRD